MKEIVKINFLKSLVYGYALIQLEDESSKNNDSLYVQRTKQIVKYFSKAKPPKALTQVDRVTLSKLQQKVKALDASYFEDKMFCGYIVAIIILDYLIYHKKDLTMRTAFLHFSTKTAISEVEQLFRENGTAKSHYKYVSLILEMIGE